VHRVADVARAGAGAPRISLRTESSFSEEKESKRLLFLVVLDVFVTRGKQSLCRRKIKSLFASFSSEKEDSSSTSNAKKKFPGRCRFR
jgi:hypothetical protein